MNGDHPRRGNTSGTGFDTVIMLQTALACPQQWRGSCPLNVALSVERYFSNRGIVRDESIKVSSQSGVSGCCGSSKGWLPDGACAPL